jgi:hypothetical protein
MFKKTILAWLIAFLAISTTVQAQSSNKTDQANADGKKKSLLIRDEASSTATESKGGSETKKVPATPVGTGAKQVASEPKTDAKPVSTNLRKVDRKQLTASPSNASEKVVFKYKFTPGLVIQSQVTHLAKTNTKVNETEQASNSRTVSNKTWSVVESKNGEMTFEYRILDIDMSQANGSDKELRYSSKSGETAVPQFQGAADSVGKVISTVTIDEQGMILARSDDTNPPNLGMGDITLPVPAEPIGIGSTWEIPRELRIKRDDGSFKMVRFRELFRLDKISAGVATVAVRSEMLTAVTDPKEEAQVLQQLSNGTIKFDLDAGRMISKELAWDKTVVGFAGDGSVMDYSARLEEEVVKTAGVGR